MGKVPNSNMLQFPNESLMENCSKGKFAGDQDQEDLTQTSGKSGSTERGILNAGM